MVWTTIEVDPETTDRGFSGISYAGGQTWLLGAVEGAPVIWKVSSGPELERIDLGSAPGEGASIVRGLVEGGNGQLIGYGSRAFDCRGNLCTESGGVLWTSTDGTTWAQSAPSEWNPGGGVQVTVNGLAYHGGEYVAAVTFAEPDWRAYVYTSADGLNWTRGARLESDGHAVSGAGVFSDGVNLVVQAHVHVCADPYQSPQGWVPSASWTDHIRIWQGTAASALAGVDSAEMPLVQPEATYDCATTTSSDLAREPEFAAKGSVIDGTITFLDTTAIEWSDQAPERRVVRLVDGEWESESIEPDADLSDPTSMAAFSTGQGYGFVEFQYAQRGRPGSILSDAFPHRAMHDSNLYHMRLWLNEGGSWTQAVGETPVPSAGVIGGFVDGEKIVIFGNQGLGSPRLVLWTTEAADPALAATCELGPGASCFAVDVASMLGESGKDLSGMDLSGADFRFADLSGLNFDGANLSGARMSASYAEGASFVGTNFTGADLNHAWIADLKGAILDQVNFYRGNFLFTGAPASMTGANGFEAQFIYGTAEQTDGLEAALVGIDLTWATIVPGPEEGPLLVITDLSGSNVTSTKFTRSDLSKTVLSGTTWAGLVRFSPDSVCPDGGSPVLTNPNLPTGECSQP